MEEKLQGQNYLADRFLTVSGVFRTMLLKQELIRLLLDKKKQICSGGMYTGEEELWGGKKGWL